MNIDLREELRKRDELLDGYLKQIEIQEEFIQKQKEMIEISGRPYFKDHRYYQRRLTDKTMPGEKVCLMLMTVLHSCAA